MSYPRRSSLFNVVLSTSLKFHPKTKNVLLSTCNGVFKTLSLKNYGYNEIKKSI